MLIFSVTLCYAEPEYVVEPKLFRLMFGSFPQWEEITRDDETLYRYAALAIRDVDDALSDSVFDFDNYDEVLVTNLSDTFPMLIVKSSTLKSELWFTPMVDISVDILDTYLNTDFEIE